MKVLAVVSQKGGVGKTTVALNTAFALAKRNHRVLLVDTDPQGGVGLSLSKVHPSDGLAGYVGRKLSLERVLIKTRLPQLALLPMGNIAIQDTHAFASRLANGHEVKRLVTDAHGSFDVVMLDTPSGFTGVTLGAMRVATHVMSPLQAEPLALRSSTQLLEVLGAMRQEGAGVALAGFVLTMLDLRNADSLGVATEAWAGFPEAAVLQTTIPRDPIFLKASGAGVPVGLLSTHPPPVAALFDQVAVELETRIGLGKELPDDGPISLFA